MSHKKFGSDRFSRFDVYWIQTNKQTDKPNLYIDNLYVSKKTSKEPREGLRPVNNCKNCLKIFHSDGFIEIHQYKRKKIRKISGTRSILQVKYFPLFIDYLMYNFTRYYCEQNHNNSLKARRARIAAARKEEENARFSDWGIQSVPTSPVQHHSKLTLTNGLSTLSFKWSFMLRFKYAISNEQDNLSSFM